MPSRSGTLLFAALAASLLALPGFAGPQQAGAEPQDPPADAASTPAEVAPHLMTCADVGAALRDEAREEEASYLIVWAYGVRTGVEGLDFAKYPVTKEGLQDFVTHVTLVCKADPDKKFVDAILE